MIPAGAKRSRLCPRPSGMRGSKWSSPQSIGTRDRFASTGVVLLPVIR